MRTVLQQPSRAAQSTSVEAPLRRWATTEELEFDLELEPEKPRPGSPRPGWRAEGQSVKEAIIRWLEEQV